LQVRCYASKQYKDQRDKMKFGHYPDIARYDFNKRWKNDVVYVKASNYFVGFLFMNTIYSDQLLSFQAADKFLYPKILSLMFRPVARIQEAIDEFAEQNLHGGECISVFARTTGVKGPVNEYKHLFRSTEDANRLLGPQHFDCARRFFSKKLASNTTIFVASLYKEVKSYFKANHENVVYLNEDVGAQFDVLNRDYSVLDMYLLARCKYAIYSYSSTFGQVARALSTHTQEMYQTNTPTLSDGITPLIDGIGKTLYSVEGDCKPIRSQEACSAPWVRWINTNQTSQFYEVADAKTKFPATFQHGRSC